MMQDALRKRPNIWLVGDAEHADFAEAVSLLRSTGNVGLGLPALIVVAQSRPGMIRLREIERLRRSAPLAGMVSLLGSWCEGETRTGRPVAGVQRLYWYEFPSWWRRQIALRAAGKCPDWARAERNFGIRTADCELMGQRIAVETSSWDAMAAIRDLLRSAGAEAFWYRPERGLGNFEGVAAGIWEGGQLSDSEAERLAAFCEKTALVGAPVVALLDFPRRERCEVARHCGAVGVLGKPWGNSDLLRALGDAFVAQRGLASAA